MNKIIEDVFKTHRNALSSLEEQSALIEEVSGICISALRSGNKIIFCGNGGSAADSQHLAAEFVGRFKKDDVVLPALALSVNTSLITALGNDFGFDTVFSQQIRALGAPGDVLVAISTSGNSTNIIKAVEQAKSQKIKTIGLLGRNGGTLKQLVDVPFVIDQDDTARVQEIHIIIGHIVCEMVDAAFSDGK